MYFYPFLPQGSSWSGVWFCIQKTLAEWIGENSTHHTTYIHSQLYQQENNWKLLSKLSICCPTVSLKPNPSYSQKYCESFKITACSNNCWARFVNHNIQANAVVFLWRLKPGFSTTTIMWTSIIPSKIQLLIVNIYFFYKIFSLD